MIEGSHGMNFVSEDSLEDLVELRTTVRDWVNTAKESVLSFHREYDDAFWEDTDQFSCAANRLTSGDGTKLNPTITARAYMALTYADCCLAKNGDDKSPKWINQFRDFLYRKPFKLASSDITDDAVSTEDDDTESKEMKANGSDTKIIRQQPPKGVSDPKKVRNYELNNFETAHLADYLFVADYVRRFYAEEFSADANLIRGAGTDWKGPLTEILAAKLQDELSDKIDTDGQLNLERDRGESRHYFVTLHTLRALAILNGESKIALDSEGLRPANDIFSSLTDIIRQFCVEQCFNTHRNIRHKQDPFRLAFAAVIYCLYAPHLDKELAVAMIEALAATQQDNGIWPATHPIIRGAGKRPWHISSHEISLCLTWLYFQPRIPDRGRVLLLEMMEKYFTHWVIPAYVRLTKRAKPAAPPKETAPSAGTQSEGTDPEGELSKTFSGWYDDHTSGTDRIVSWATAIVCHFLANYHSVLDNHINRRVIESLNLEDPSEHYLIEETAHDKAPKWSRSTTILGIPPDNEKPVATWVDLPPFAWSDRKEIDQLSDKIQWHWTDPYEGGNLSKKLALRVLSPTLKTPSSRPDKKFCAGLFPGPPGTRKTTLVKTLANLLDWPLVMVPASVIFDKGFDMMETRATEVFRCLNYLTNCVIFFDEFEEFFRDRQPSPIPVEVEDIQNNAAKDRDDLESGEQKDVAEHFQVAVSRYPILESIPDRTIAAFTTSSMLPRLQELHDEARCLIFLATNHLDKIDEAIIRPGRFDFQAKINHSRLDRFIPSKKTEKSYLIRPTKRTLENLKFEIDENKRDVIDIARFKALRTAVMRALEDERVKDALTDLNKKKNKRDNARQVPLDEIPFTFVEDALNVVVKVPSDRQTGWRATDHFLDASLFLSNRRSDG